MHDRGRIWPFADDQQPGFNLTKQQKFSPKMIIMAVILAVVFLIISGFVFYTTALGPVDPSATSAVRVIISQGQTASQIADTLYEHELIQNPKVFELYTQFSGAKSKLQAGGFMLKRSHSVPEIVDRLISGKSDEMNVTFLPGLTLEELSDKAVSGSLSEQRYSDDEIKTALAKAYDSPLFKLKPDGASLEGYLYPETYVVPADTSLDAVVKMTLDVFYKQINSKGLVEKLKKQNLTLPQGIILASIVQKEVSNPTDQKQVAQVFLKRLKENKVLGSDVTFMYIAKKEGREPRVNDPSPYNTRRNPGLPPGPISNFHIEALEAVADPAPGDFEYFVAGDDGTTHFSRTEAEHNSNIEKYCKKLCN